MKLQCAYDLPSAFCEGCKCGHSYFYITVVLKSLKKDYLYMQSSFFSLSHPLLKATLLC